MPTKVYGQMTVTRTIDGEETEVIVALSGKYVPTLAARGNDASEGGYVEDIKAMHGNDEIGLTDPELSQAELILLEDGE